MTTLLHFIVGLVLFLLLFNRLIAPAIVAFRLRRVLFRKSVFTLTDSQDVAFFLPSAQAFLQQQGFDHPIPVNASHPLVGSNTPLTYLLAQHPASHSWALIAQPDAVSANNWWRFECYTPLADGSCLLTTTDTTSQLGLSRPAPEFKLDCLSTLNPDDVWVRHQQRLAAAGQAAAITSPTDIIDLLTGYDQALQDPLLFSPVGNDNYKPSLLFSWRLFHYERQRKQFVLSQLKQNPKEQASRVAELAACSSPDQQLAAFDTYRLLKQQMRSKNSNKGMWLIISLGLFALSFGLGLSLNWQTLALLIAVLLLHEGGHLLSMKLFGYRDLNMLFIPFLGALAMGEKERVSAWQETIMLLMGPMPGYLLGIYLLTQATPATPTWVLHFAYMATFINLFNLLPLMPLDGGQLMNLAIFNRFSRLQPLLLLLSVLAFAAFALYLESKFIWLLVVILLLTLPSSWRESKLLHWLRKDRHFQAGDITAHTLLSKLTPFPLWQKIPADQRWPLLDNLMMRLRRSQTSLMGGLAIFLVWVSCLLAPPLLAAPPQITAMLKNFVLTDSAVPDLKTQLAGLEKNYQQADTDQERVRFALRIAETERLLVMLKKSNNDRSKIYWDSAKQLTLNGKMSPSERGNLLVKLAFQCGRFEKDCEAGYFQQALAHLTPANDAELMAQTQLRLAQLDYVPTAQRLNATAQGSALAAHYQLYASQAQLLWQQAQLLLQQGNSNEAEKVMFASQALLVQPENSYYRQDLRTRLANYYVIHQQAPRALELLQLWLQQAQQEGDNYSAGKNAYYLMTLSFDRDPEQAHQYFLKIINTNNIGPIEQELAQLLLAPQVKHIDYHSSRDWARLLKNDSHYERYALATHLHTAQLSVDPSIFDDAATGLTRSWFLHINQLLQQPPLSPLQKALNDIQQEQAADEE